MGASPRVRRAVVVPLLAVAALGSGALTTRSPAVVAVSPDDSLQAVVSSAPAGAVIRLDSGRHRGPVTVSRRLTIEGPSDAIVTAPRAARAAVTVRADSVTLAGFAVAGGETGVYVRDSDKAEIAHLTITGSEMQGIDVADAHADIHHVTVRNLTNPRAQGVEIRNSEHRGTTSVTDSVVSGGQEGIVSHVSRVRFENNVVTNTTMHGLSITEMSRGSAGGNTVSDAAGAGLYCGDMSLCDFHGNEVARVRAANGTRSGAGWGLLVHYHSSAHDGGNVLDGSAGSVGAFGGARMRERSALRLGDGWNGLAPALWVVPLALVALAGAARLGHGWIRPRAQRALPWVVPVALVGVGVQTFHMLEHGLQVYRVHFDGVPSRGGIVGPGVEAEWIHFTYNLLVLSTLVLVASARRQGWNGAAHRRADGLLAGAVVLQGYHVVEHGVKVVQHVASGAKVNPGIAGQWIDLVWLHFGINLAVYIGFAAAMFLLGPGLGVRRAGRRPRATVAAD